MKQVFTRQDAGHVGMMFSVLDAAGIPCEIRNDAVYRAIPSVAFFPELWVLSDEDYPEAMQLITEMTEAEGEDREG